MKRFTYVLVKFMSDPAPPSGAAWIHDLDLLRRLKYNLESRAESRMVEFEKAELLIGVSTEVES